MKKLDLTGQRFGKLTAREYSGSIGKKTFWLCQCDCGKETTVATINLRNGGTKSCGCLRTSKFEPGYAGLKKLFLNYKKSARRNDRTFELTMDEFKIFTSMNCNYCGNPPSIVSATEHSYKQEVIDHTAYKFNGLDRVDSSKGYEKNNVVPCCFWCNIMKRDKSEEEFRKHIEQIFKHMKLGDTQP